MQPFDLPVSGAEPDAYWNVVLGPVDRHIQQHPLDITSLIDLSGTICGSGNRLINKVPRLLDSLIDDTREVKADLAKTSGLRSGAETDEYDFGGSYFAAHIVAPVQGGDIRSSALCNIRFQLHDDNYFASVRNSWSGFRRDQPTGFSPPLSGGPGAGTANKMASRSAAQSRF